MLYSVGDKLICKRKVNTRELEMCNIPYDIKVGDEYIVTDKDDYPDENHCHWYELTSKDRNVKLSAWNDEEHMIIDESFEIIHGTKDK